MCLKSRALVEQEYFIYMAGKFFIYLSPVVSAAVSECCDYNGDSGSGLILHRVFPAVIGPHVPIGRLGRG